MTEDEIIEFTKRSGLGMLLEIGGMNKCLEHFAKLVAQHEQDRIFKRAEVAAELAIEHAIELEREACAKVCDDMDSISDYYTLRVELICAQAIRARGQA